MRSHNWDEFRWNHGYSLVLFRMGLFLFTLNTSFDRNNYKVNKKDHIDDISLPNIYILFSERFNIDNKSYPEGKVIL